MLCVCFERGGAHWDKKLRLLGGGHGGLVNFQVEVRCARRVSFIFLPAITMRAGLGRQDVEMKANGKGGGCSGVEW